MLTPSYFRGSTIGEYSIRSFLIINDFVTPDRHSTELHHMSKEFEIEALCWNFHMFILIIRTKGLRQYCDKVIETQNSFRHLYALLVLFRYLERSGSSSPFSLFCNDFRMWLPHKTVQISEISELPDSFKTVKTVLWSRSLYHKTIATLTFIVITNPELTRNVSNLALTQKSPAFLSVMIFTDGCFDTKNNSLSLMGNRDRVDLNYMYIWGRW